MNGSWFGLRRGVAFVGHQDSVQSVVMYEQQVVKMVRYLEQLFSAKEFKTWVRLAGGNRKWQCLRTRCGKPGKGTGRSCPKALLSSSWTERIEGIMMCQQWLCGESNHEPCRSVIEYCRSQHASEDACSSTSWTEVSLMWRCIVLRLQKTIFGTCPST